LQLNAQGLPAGILVIPGYRVGEYRQSHRAEAAETCEKLLFVRSGGTFLLLKGFQGADGGEDVAGFGLLAAGKKGSVRAGGSRIR